MKKYLFITLFFIPIATLAQSLSIGLYNIRYDNPHDKKAGNGWIQRAPGIYNLINYESWDIFGAQEVLHNQLTDLLANIDGYDYIGVGRNDGAQKGEYAPIFYKKNRIECLDSGHFWLSETPDSVGSKGWDAAICRICTWGFFEDKSSKWRFWVFNLHMDHIGKTARRESAKLVLAKIKEKCGSAPCILTGDFNVNQNDEIYSILTASNALNDAFAVAKHRMCETGTTNKFDPQNKTDNRIDHIFLTEHFKVHRYGVLTYNYWESTKNISGKGKTTHKARMLSDHYPVEATVELPLLRSQQDWAQYNCYAKENLGNEESEVVFIGNSIIYNWKRLCPEFFEKNEGYVCRGISGQVTAQMLARFRSDVINLNPDKVVILAGTNDIAMNQGYVSVEHIYENIVSMAEIAKHNGIKVILCSVLPTDGYSWSWEINRERATNSIQRLNTMLREYAQKKRLKFADFYSAMADENMALKKEYQQDTVHPNKAGYLVMEEIIMDVLE